MNTPVRFQMPHIVRRLLRLDQKLLLAAAVIVGASPAMANCPTTSGSGQAVVAGSYLAQPLIATSVETATPPPTETFNWSVNYPLAFTSNNYQYVTDAQSWTMSGPNYIATSQQGLFVPSSTTPGSHTVTLTNTTCPSPPTMFTIDVGALLNPTATVYSGDYQLASIGEESAEVEVKMTHTDPGGGPTVLAAVNVPMTFVITTPSFASFDQNTVVTTKTVITDAAGIARFTYFVPSGATPDESILINGSASGYPSVIIHGTTNIPLYDIVIVDGDGQTVPTGGQSDPLIVETQENGMAYSAPVTFTVIQGDATITESGGSTFTTSASQSTHTIHLNHGNTEGSVQVEATSPGFNGVVFNLTTGANVSIITVQGDNQTIPTGGQSEPIVFETPGLVLNIDLTVIQGDATFVESGTASHSSNPDVDGYHTVHLQAGNSPGPVVILATAPDIDPGYAYAMIESSVPLEPIDILSGDGQKGPIGSVLPVPLAVRVAPADGASVSRPKAGESVDVTFAVSAGQAYFVANNQSTITVPADGNHEASVSLRLGNEIGDVRVTASAPGFTPAHFGLTALAPAAVGYSLTPVSPPSAGTTGMSSAPLVVAFTHDGTPVSGANIHWQLVSGDAVLAASTTTTDGNGRAQNSAQFSLTPGINLVRAEVQPDQNSAPLQVDFTLNVADPTLSVTAGDAQSGAIGTLLDQPIQFQLRGGDGLPISGQTVQFSIVGDAALTTPASATTDANGHVSAMLRFGSQAGSVHLDATALSGRANARAQASAYVPALTILSGNQQSAPAGSALPQPLAVKLLTQSGALPALAKGLGGLTVSWQITCGNGSLASATTTTDAAGESRNQLTLGTSPGCNEVQASITGIGSVEFTATGTLPGNAVLEIVSGNGQSLLPGAESAPLRVRLRSPGGEPIAGIVIRFAANGSDAQFTHPEASTGNDGTASTTLRAALPSRLRVTASVRDIPSITPVQFEFNVGIASLPGLTPPQRRIAEVIDTACPTLAAIEQPTPRQLDLLQRCSELVVNAEPHPGDVRDALGMMLADEGNAQSAAALASANSQLDHLKSRFAAVRSGMRGVDLSGLNVVASGGVLPLSLLPSAIAMAVGEPPKEVGADFSRWGFFATGTIGRGTRDPDTLDPGFEYDSYDITAGVDYRATESWILGAALGFNRNDTKLPNGAGGMDASGWALSGYASWFHGDSWYVDAVASYGRNSYDIERRIRYNIASLSGGETVVDQLASGSPDGDRQSLSLSMGRDFAKGAWTFGPYLRVAYSKLDFDGYTESMSDLDGFGNGLALSVDARRIKSLHGVIGGKFSYAISTSWGILIPNAQFEWVNEFEDDPEVLVTRFTFDPLHTPIVIESAGTDKSYGNLGLGLSGVFAEGRSGYVYYERTFGQEHMNSDSLAIGVRIEF